MIPAHQTGNAALSTITTAPQKPTIAAAAREFVSFSKGVTSFVHLLPEFTAFKMKVIARRSLIAYAVAGAWK